MPGYSVKNIDLNFGCLLNVYSMINAILLTKDKRKSINHSVFKFYQFVICNSSGVD